MNRCVHCKTNLYPFELEKGMCWACFNERYSYCRLCDTYVKNEDFGPSSTKDCINCLKKQE